MSRKKMFIGGCWKDGSSSMPILNPADESVIAEVPVADTATVQRAIERARDVQLSWGQLPPVERGKILRRWADLVDQNVERLAQTITKEQGKPITEARGEVVFGNSWFRYYAEFDRRIQGDILPADRADEQIWITIAPIGVVAGVIPWNYPFAVAVRKIAPALIAGNSIVLKPHEDTPLSALELAELGEQAGLPEGVLSVITGPGETVGEALVTSPIPRLITFTGSVTTGKRIMRNAANNVAAVSLEMGGKAPFLVMEDCDLEEAARVAANARFMNCGQVCICNERTYVQRSVKQKFLDLFLTEVAKLTIGNPLSETTNIGPKVNLRELEKVERYVNEAKAAGGEILTGGKRSDKFQAGYWFEPTVIVNVQQSAPIVQEEVFGPVVPILEFDRFDDGMRFANDSKFGLAAYLFTNDMNRVMRAVRDMECGELYVNRGPGESIHGYHTGWKLSGIGGDDGKYGLDHYLQRKTIYLRYQ